jgi:hypothetical protein
LLSAARDRENTADKQQNGWQSRPADQPETGEGSILFAHKTSGSGK